MLDVLAESQGQSPASDTSFRAWAESVPCRQFDEVFALSVSRP